MNGDAVARGMRAHLEVELDLVERDLRSVNADLDALYWSFTRTARGKPPCVVRPDLYVRRRALELRRREIVRHLLAV